MLLIVLIPVFFPFLFKYHAEFSALVLNTGTGLVESVFHHYVRPIHFPNLSQYCINTTGITQSFIDQQKPFTDVYSKFLSWMRQNIIKRNLVFATPQSLHSPNGLNATFCSWTDWDLGHYLYRDCLRNDQSLYECMKAWIDVRRVFDVSRISFQFFLFHVFLFVPLGCQKINDALAIYFILFLINYLFCSWNYKKTGNYVKCFESIHNLWFFFEIFLIFFSQFLLIFSTRFFPFLSIANVSQSIEILGRAEMGWY